MTQSIINTLFAVPAKQPAGKQAAAATESPTQSFGNVLSREMRGRDEINGRAAQPQSAPAQTKSNNAEAASARARQQQQRSTERVQSANAAAARQASTNLQTAKNAASVKPAPDTVKTDRPKPAASDNDDESPVSGGADTTNRASAELLALVGSLNSKTPPATQPEDAAIDKTADQAGTAAADALMNVAADVNAETASEGVSPDAKKTGDAAFEAMVAQAALTAKTAQATQSNGAGSAQATLQNAGNINTSDLQNAGSSHSRSAFTTDQAGFAGSSANDAAGGLAITAKLEAVAATVTSSLAASAPADAAQLAALSNTPAVTSTALQPTGLVPGEKLVPFVGTPAWNQALGQKVVWMVAGAEQSASLTLNPPDLGPLQVVINVNNSHAQASFTAAEPEVRQALEAAMPQLKEMLAGAGISLGQTNINAGNPNQQNEQAQQRSSANGGRGRDRPGVDATQASTVLRSERSGGNGLVDTFA